MKEEIQRWWKQAGRDLKAAKNSARTGSYDWACFQAQQAVEKALKALHLKEFHELRRIHDIVFLARKVRIPADMLDACIRLNQVYVETRYPDASGRIPAEKFRRADAISCIGIAEGILRWLKKKLSEN